MQIWALFLPNRIYSRISGRNNEYPAGYPARYLDQVQTFTSCLEWSVTYLYEISCKSVWFKESWPNRISGRISGSSPKFNQFYLWVYWLLPPSFMQIGYILRKFIQPIIRPDIRIITKINRDLFWHRNMNSWKSHVVSYYRFWDIVWTNIHTKISNPDIRPDVRPDNRIEFKLSPVL